MKSIHFVAEIKKHGVGMAVEFPGDVEKLFGTRGQVRVNVTFDGHPYRGSMAPMGTGCHLIGVLKSVAAAIGKKPGDEVDVEVTRDIEERIVDVPPALEALLKKNQQAKVFFETLSYTNRKEYAVWISSAAKEETRERRLRQIIEKLMAGKKNPSEK